MKYEINNKIIFFWKNLLQFDFMLFTLNYYITETFQIYSLNRIMTESEHRSFANFVRINDLEI